MPVAMMPKVATFVGGTSGIWKILGVNAIVGTSMKSASQLNIIEGLVAKPPPGGKWLLRGVTSNERYTTRAEHDRLAIRQPSLGRTEATYAALIPIRKSPDWWNLPQDERRAIFETRSHHIRIGLRSLPAIARRLYHCRDLGGPFDFLTWFEYGPRNEAKFNQLVAKLRKTEEWTFVEREVEIRLAR